MMNNLSDWYDKNLTNTVHESLYISSCVDNHYISPIDNKCHKLYRCECKLCGALYEFVDDDFKIEPYPHVQQFSTEDRIITGYWSEAHCNCHLMSSFQWKVIKILKEYNIKYDVEITFNDLISSYDRKTLLAYDFGIYNPDGSYKYLIECNGVQHYKPVYNLGGTLTYERQKNNDIRKRAYADSHMIPLIEIPYTTNKLFEIKNILKAHHII